MKAVFFLLYLLQLLPLPLLHKVADAVGFAAYFLAKKRRLIGETNLCRCFPDWTEQRRKAVLRAHFRHMAKLALEYGLYWYAPPQRLKSLVRYQDKHHLDQALAAGRKVILLYPHFTAFELAVYALNQDVPLISVYSHQKNPAIDRRILQGRQRYRNVFLIDRTEGLRSVIKRIKTHNAPFLYLPDQDFGRKDSVFVDFFGIPAATIAGLGRIAAMTRAVVIPAIPTRLDDGSVVLRFYPEWQDFPEASAEADARRMNAFIEARVAEQPEQYFWLHKRFKTRPAGEADFYA